MDMEALMAQAGELQNRVSMAQEKLAQTHIKGIAEDGAVIVDITGKYDMAGITIRPDVLDRGAPAIEKLVMSAYNDAKAKADATIDEVMGVATAGIPMP